MGMTERDRKVLGIVLVLIVLGGYWFLVVKKKQDAIKQAQTEQQTAQADLDSAKLAEQQAKELAKVKPASYNKLVRLGKAVPNNDDFQSLLVQINDISDDADVNFVSLTSNKSATGTVGAGSTSSCDSGGGASGSTGSAGATGATAAPAPTPTPAPTASTGSTGGSTGATGESASSSGTATAAASCATAPTLTDITASSAGLTKYDYNFTFQGSFYDLHKVFDNILDLVRVNDGKVGVTGRLLDISQIDLAVGTFPNLNASVAMTGYSIPADANTGSSAAAAAATATAATGTEATQ